MERIKNRDKLLKKYKKSKLEVDHQIYREAKFVASTLIKSKKTNYFKQKIVENTGNSKKIWKTLNSLGMPSKKDRHPLFVWKRMAIFRLTPKSMQGFLRTSTLILPTIATSKYDMNYVRDYYNNIEPPDEPFGFSHAHKSQKMNIL